jgi:hypothetical protein
VSDTQVAEPEAIAANPVDALETIIASHESSATEKARNDKGQFIKSDEDIRKELAKEFPEFEKKNYDVEQPEAGGESPAEGSKKAESEQVVEAVEPTKRQDGKAIDILKRAQISQARIDALTPSERVAWAKELKPVVVGWQQAAQKAAEGRKDPETIASVQSGSKAGEPHDTPTPELAEAVKGIERDYGPELAASLEKMVRSAVAPLQKKLDEAEASKAQAGQAELKASIKQARAALAGRFPELEDDDVFESDVFPVMVGLESSGRYTTADMEKLVSQAARIADLDEAEPQAKVANEKLARLQRNGTASSKGKGIQPGTKTKDEKETLAAKLALDPRVSVEEARRRVYGS